MNNEQMREALQLALASLEKIRWLREPGEINKSKASILVETMEMLAAEPIAAIRQALASEGQPAQAQPAEPLAPPDKGPWAAGWGGQNLYIHSEDFTHDAALMVTGDFGSDEDRMKYAQGMADWMNAKLSHPPAEPARKAEPVACELLGYMYPKDIELSKKNETFALVYSKQRDGQIPIYTHPPTDVVHELLAAIQSLLEMGAAVVYDDDIMENRRRRERVRQLLDKCKEAGL